MTPKCQPPIQSSLDPELALNRIKIYADYKKPVLDRAIGYKNDISYIECKPATFVDLLNKVANPRSITDSSQPMYDGLRIYFATYCWHPEDCDGNVCIPVEPNSPTHDCRDHLTLIFVPTSAINDTHLDDISNCWIIKKNKDGTECIHTLPNPKMVSKTRDTASRWIRNYQFGKNISLATDARFRTGNNRFMETNSVWYSMAIINGGTNYDGILQYLKCLISDDPTVDYVRIQLGAYIISEENPSVFPPYQLTIIFNFHQKEGQGAEKDNYFGSSTFIGADDFKKSDADTGLPCPPDRGCQSGSQLPA